MGRVESEVMPNLAKCGCELGVRGCGVDRAISLLKVCGNHKAESGEGHQVTENSSAKASECGDSYITPAANNHTCKSHCESCVHLHTPIK